MSPNEIELSVPHAADATASDANGHAPSQEPSGAARVACFVFAASLAAALAVVAVFLSTEKSALRRTDADVVGLLADRTAESMTACIQRSGGTLDRNTFGMLQVEVAHLAEVRGVQQVALLFDGGEEVISAQSPEVSKAFGGTILPLPEIQGPGRTLAEDHLIVARAFRLRGGDTEDAMLIVKSGYPLQVSQMRDLIALSGRTIGLIALFLVFLSPLFSRMLLRGHGRVARHVRAGETPSLADASGSGAEVVDLVARIVSDSHRIEKIERAQVELTEAARDRLSSLRENAETHRRAADVAQKEARSATAAKAAFVANTSHEIRTPLHAVLGTTSLMLETDLDAEQRSLAERSMRASQMLLSLVDDVLDLARFDAREIAMEPVSFDPSALVEEVAELAAPLAASKGLEVAAFCSPECPTKFMGDASRIRQAMMRLVDNAIKFTDAGEITIDVAWEASEDGVPRAVFTISDTGLGIGDQERARLFRAFEQLDASNTRRHGGVGLGLALVARIARACGGEVRLESRRGRGSRFCLALPLPIDPAEARGLAERITERPRPLAGLSVLVLDDAQAGAELFGRTLELMGAKAHIEASTYAGFEAFVRDAADVVFLNAKLPGRDAFLGALESNDQRGPVPVVLMTPPLAGKAHAQSGDEAVSAMIAKPLSRADIESVVLRVLGRDSRRDEERAVDAESAAKRKALLETHMRRRIRILLVEDNKTNQQLVQYVLGKRGYQIDVASNGRRAVDAFAASKYDAILMDCQMPEMDGYEATRRIRALEESLDSKTPILAMTASVLDSDRDKCLSAGMDDMLGKPFQPHRMVEWLEGWLLKSLYGEGGEGLAATIRARPVASEQVKTAQGPAGRAPNSSPTIEATRLAWAESEAMIDGAGGMEPVPAAPGRQDVAPSQESNVTPFAFEESPSWATPVSRDSTEVQAPLPAMQAEAPSGSPMFDEAEVAAAVDIDVLSSLLEDEEGRILANELIDSFLSIAPEKLRELERAIASGELPVCAEIAHGLVSTSGTVGAIRLAHMLRDVERFASRGNHVDSGRLVKACRDEVEMARYALVRAIGA